MTLFFGNENTMLLWQVHANLEATPVEQFQYKRGKSVSNYQDNIATALLLASLSRFGFAPSTGSLAAWSGRRASLHHFTDGRGKLLY